MSDNNAFFGGVLPGGLRTQNDIRILICYLLKSTNSPISEENLTKIAQENGLANYFEVMDAISSLLSSRLIKKNPDGDLEICEEGLQVAKELDSILPASVRSNALQAAIQILAKTKLIQENRVDIEKTDTGYQVHCNISGGDLDLMNISLYVPDKKQANFVKTTFQKDPGKIYQLLLSALTDEDEGTADSDNDE